MCQFDEQASCFLVATQDVMFPLSDRIVRHAVLQAAVQEAIEARGWLWLVGGSDNHKSAQVRKQVYGYSFDVIIERVSPAQALLSAYLKALRAQ